MDAKDGPASKLHRYLRGKREACQGEDSRGLGRHEMRVYAESSEDEGVRHERRRAGNSGGPPFYKGNESLRSSARMVVEGYNIASGGSGATEVVRHGCLKH